MTWLRIDDGMVDHRKWAALEEDPRTWSECLAVWLALASYCARVSSDGFVEDARIGRLTPLGARARQRCDDLVRVGLMEREDGGYRFHDWLHYQPSAADVTRDREAARVRQRRARDEARSRRESRDLSRRDIPRDSHGTGGVSHGPPVPSRPVPSPLALASESRARAPEAPARLQSPDPEPDPVESALRRGYQARYQREARDAWMTHVRDDEHVRRAASWCRMQPRPLEAAERLLDGAFGHEPWRAKRWPWKWLSEDPGLTASRSSLPTGVMGDHASIDDAVRERMAAIPTMDLTPVEGETW